MAPPQDPLRGRPEVRGGLPCVLGGFNGPTDRIIRSRGVSEGARRQGKPAMIRSFTMAVAVALCATGALAADLPQHAPSPVFLAPAKPFDWTGGYAGLNLGSGFATSAILMRSPGVLTGRASEILDALKSDRLRTRSVGILGGGQIGFNFQSNPGSGAVLGLEVDAQYADLRGHRRAMATGLEIGGQDSDRTYTENTGIQSQSGLQFLGSVRGRIGYGFDRVLVYGTAGFAYASASHRGAIGDAYRWTGGAGGGGETKGVSLDSHGVQPGYVFGAGVEYALPADNFLNFFGGSAVTVKAEYLHYDFGNSIPAGGAAGLSDLKFRPAGNAAKLKYEVDTFRAGINYRFGIF